jgi:L-alanine-DL-glutamate epimerase-like enolase superfamily enzyme
MKIISIHSYSKKLLLKKPYTITRSTIDEAENVFFEVTLENGITGIGSASTEPAVVGETAEQTLKHLQSETVSKLIGTDIRQFLFLIDEYRCLYPAFPGTQAAIDIALHDAFGQFLGIPVVDFYGRVHQKMMTSVTIGIKDVAATLEEAQEYYLAGFRALKVKTGLNAKTDAERIIKLREKYGNHFEIRVDANTGYDVTQLQSFLDKTAHQDIELIEQPFLPVFDQDLLRFPHETRMMLAADESLKDARSALELAKLGAFGIFNIKLMKCGGIRGALEIANVAKQADISLFWGCNDESVVSITAAVHAAFSCRHTRYIDLDGSFDLAEDIVSGGFILSNGYMYPSGEPGLGLRKL